MKLNHARSILLGTTILLPGLLFAQVDPTASPATQTQPGRPQHRPGPPGLRPNPQKTVTMLV